MFPGAGLSTPHRVKGVLRMSELGVVLIVMAAVAGVLILIFWVLPWVIDLGGDPDESIPASEIIRRVEDEQR
ncbi:hypothetical protein [Nocardia sp. NPDC019255]|uniref:hypothetical protein n=2 Tax=Nocardia TaxID=1817 RepID=UPI0033C68E9F